MFATSFNYSSLNERNTYPNHRWTAFRDSKNPLPPAASDDGDGTLVITDVTEFYGRLQYCCDVSNRRGEVLSKCITIDVLSK